MNVMRKTEPDRPAGSDRPAVLAPGPAFADAPPDPFEDVAAPPLRSVAEGRAARVRSVRADATSATSPADPDLDALGAVPIAEDRPSGAARAAAAACEPAGEALEVAVPTLGLAPQPSTSAARDAGAAPPSVHDRGRRALLLAIALGLALAAAIVALALVFRPAPAATADAAPAALGAGPLPAAQSAERGAAASTPVSESAVRLRIGPDLSQERRDALRAALADAGYRTVDVLPMPVPFALGRVEYFNALDRAAAEALARGLAPLTRTLLEVRDLGSADGAATPGRLEVWIAD